MLVAGSLYQVEQCIADGLALESLIQTCFHDNYKAFVEDSACVDCRALSGRTLTNCDVILARHGTEFLPCLSICLIIYQVLFKACDGAHPPRSVRRWGGCTAHSRQLCFCEL